MRWSHYRFECRASSWARATDVTGEPQHIESDAPGIQHASQYYANRLQHQVGSLEAALQLS